jgi:(p)ppGpp synthase/HD superfamily hydrolase
MNEMLKAEAVARFAHAGQFDKNDVPYIEHPKRVAARVKGDDEAVQVAWLHDVIEDTDVSVQDLEDHGFSPAVVAAVVAITRLDSDQGDEYYERVKQNPLALKVKKADLDDNEDPERVAQLPVKHQQRLARKYQHAHEVLGV